MSPKVSVIIPVYNAEKYLPQCLNSVLQQTLQEIELICVDDGSTDGSLKILEDYASRDIRVCVISQQNQFAGVARNRGLQQAKGKYVCFWDADDFVDPALLEKTYAKAEATKADIVLFQISNYNSEKNSFTPGKHLRLWEVEDLETFNRCDVPDAICNIANPGPTNKLYRREFLLEHKLQFQAVRNSNDVYFVIMSYCLAQRIVYIDECLYFYRINTEDSLQKTKNKAPLSFIYAYEAVYDELQKLDIYETVKKSYIAAVLGAIVFNFRTTSGEEAYNTIKDYLTEHYYPKTKIMEQSEENYTYEARYRRDLLLNGLNSMPVLNLKELSYVYSFKERLAKLKENRAFEVLIAGKLCNKPLVSIIIPVYNTGTYLEQCVNSLAMQSLQNVEIICVDDGSTDDSLAILKRLAEMDGRITVCRQSNYGSSIARNNGLCLAQGKYIYFCDSDDYLEKNALEELTNQAERDELDVVYFSLDAFGDEEDACEERLAQFRKYYNRQHNYPGVYTGSALFTAMKNNREYLESPVAQLINREYLLSLGVTFMEGVIHQDNAFTFEVMLSAKRTGFIPKAFYKRRVRTGSIMVSKVSFLDGYSLVRLVENMEAFLQTKELLPEEKQAAYTQLYNIITTARLRYAKLEEAEKKTIYALNDHDRFVFNMYINGSDRIRIKGQQELQKVNAQLKNSREELQTTKKLLKGANSSLKNTQTRLEATVEKLKEAEQKLSAQNKRLQGAEKQLQEVKSGISFKLGRFLTFLPRKLLGRD